VFLMTRRLESSSLWATLPDEVTNAPLLVGQFLGDKSALAWGAISVKYRRAVVVTGISFSEIKPDPYYRERQAEDSRIHHAALAEGGSCARGVLCVHPPTWQRRGRLDTEVLDAMPAAAAARIRFLNLALVLICPYRPLIPSMHNPALCPQGHAMVQLGVYDVSVLQPPACNKPRCVCEEHLATTPVPDSRGYCSECQARIGCYSYPNRNPPGDDANRRVLDCGQCEWRLCAACTIQAMPDPPIHRPTAFGLEFSALQVLRIDFTSCNTQPSEVERQSLPQTLLCLVQNTRGTLRELDVDGGIYLEFKHCLELLRGISPLIQKLRLFHHPYSGHRGRNVDRSATLVAELAKVRPDLALAAVKEFDSEGGLSDRNSQVILTSLIPASPTQVWHDAREAGHRQLDYAAGAQESPDDILEGVRREDAALRTILDAERDAEQAELGRGN
jgi:hypothetical protein